MSIDRRGFLREATGLASAAALAAADNVEAAPADFSKLRGHFYLREGQTYLNTARHYPLNVYAARAARGYLDHMIADPADESERRRLHDIKARFARLINAKPSEICFTPGTMAGEMIMMDGLRLENTGYNVVTNDLPYSASLYNYSQRQKHGLDLRIAKHRDWRTNMKAVEDVNFAQKKVLSNWHMLQELAGVR